MILTLPHTELPQHSHSLPVCLRRLPAKLPTEAALPPQFEHKLETQASKETHNCALDHVS